MSKYSETATNAIVNEANEWLVRLQDSDSCDSDATAFTTWLHRSPVHVREYLRAEATWSALGNIDAERCIDVDALLSAEDNNVIAIATEGKRPEALGHSPTRRWLSVSIAASVALIAVVLGTIWFTGQPDAALYETGRGEQRRLVLEDGSVIDMNTQSTIAVRLTDAERHIDFVKGEALFTVAKDPDRPFVVESDLAVVRALGTQFNVYRQSDQVLVTVLEGRVAVENTTRADGLVGSTDNPIAANEQTIELAAGDQAEIIAAAPIRTVAANTERTVAWTERRLVFENQPLSEVVAEFNRYNSRQMVIEDPQLSAERISAVFDADQPDALVRFLTQSVPIEAIEEGDTRLLIQRRE